jgi:hypothetical protein
MIVFSLSGRQAWIGAFLVDDHFSFAPGFHRALSLLRAMNSSAASIALKKLLMVTVRLSLI